MVLNQQMAMKNKKQTHQRNKLRINSSRMMMRKMMITMRKSLKNYWTRMTRMQTQRKEKVKPQLLVELVLL